jgi:hypothetical protein
MVGVKVTALSSPSGGQLLYFRYWQKKLVTFNSLTIFPCYGSVTVTIYWYLNVKKFLLVATKVFSNVAEQLLRYIYRLKKMKIKSLKTNFIQEDWCCNNF